MEETQIRELVGRMDTPSAREAREAWSRLGALGEAVLPFLLEAYPRTRTAQGRVNLVYHAIRHARTNEAAFRLGLAACRDRATRVRYRACMLLAYSLRDDAIHALTPLTTHPDRETAADARAAIDAIRCKNHHYFKDRCHAGNITWDVG